jgi:beta-carotene hydroxylase
MSETTNDANIVKVPTHFFQATVQDTLVHVFKCLFLWLGPATLALLSYQYLGNSYPLSSFLLCTLLLFVSAYGLHAAGLIGHDGTHFSLLDNPTQSALLGVTVASLVPLHMDMGFAVYHADHHRFTNTDKDPDHIFFSRFKTWVSRLFLARIMTSIRYSKATITLALNRWPKENAIRIGLKKDTLVALARYNLFVSGLFLSAYLFLTIRFPVEMLFLIWIPYILLVLISGLRPYIEHAGTGHDRLNNSRTWNSVTFDLLFRGVNYHLAHHLYPSVPAYKIKKLHIWLEKNQRLGSLQERHQSNTWLDVLKDSAKVM